MEGLRVIRLERLRQDADYTAKCARRKRMRSSSVAAEAGFEACANRSPIGFREPPNQAYFPLQKRYRNSLKNDG